MPSFESSLNLKAGGVFRPWWEHMSLATRSVALQHLEPDDLHGQLQDSLAQLSLLGRKASAEIRIRLLPMLDEVKRRYDQGETINGEKGYHEYIRSLGLTPSTVRSWKTRDHQRIVGDVLQSAEKEESKRELSDLKEPDLTEEDEKFLKDFAQKIHEAKTHQTYGPVTKFKPSAKDIEEFISLGRRAAADKYHPDRGDKTGRLAQLNQVADWLKKLAGEFN